MARPLAWMTSVLTVWLEIPPPAALSSTVYAATLWMAYLGYSRSLPGRPSCCPAAWRSTLDDDTTGASIARLSLDAVHGVPSGWKSHGKPGSALGGRRTAGASGGNPTAAANGLSQGKLQGKLEGSFISIHRPSMLTPSTAKKEANSLFHQSWTPVWNQSGKTETPGHTTPNQSDPLSRLRKISSATPLWYGG